MTRAKVVALLGLGALVALGSSCGRDATAGVIATPGAGPPNGSGAYDDLVALYYGITSRVVCPGSIRPATTCRPLCGFHGPLG